MRRCFFVGGLMIGTTASAECPPDAPCAAERWVTIGEFAEWLAERPDQANAYEEGLASVPEDRRWMVMSLEERPSELAMEQVNWVQAATFCADRGGLAHVDAPPLTWGYEDTLPMVEYRQDNGKAVWRRADGATATHTDVIASTCLVGFRCAE